MSGDKPSEEEVYDIYTDVILHAAEHGINSEPDHEVGDLQDALHICLKAMTRDQLQDVAKELRHYFDIKTPGEDE